MNPFINQLRAVALEVNQGVATTRIGVITGYDPDAYAVKVLLKPDDTPTSWIPLKSIWVGNGWGLFCPPSIGDAVELDFQEGDASVACVGWRFYNDVDRPLPCPSGEFWLVHQSGSMLKFHNDGSVDLSAAGTLTTTATQWNHKGPVKVDGDIHITGASTTDGHITGNGGITTTGGGTLSGGVGLS